MSMQELTDDQLDGLFRKSAEEYNPPHDDVAWQAMGRLLDAHNQITPAPKPSFWKKNSVRGLSLLLLLLSVGGWLAYRQLRSGNQDNRAGIHKISPLAAPSATSPLAGHSASAARSVSSKLVRTNNLSATQPAYSQDAARSESLAEKKSPVALPVDQRTDPSTPDKQLTAGKITVLAATKSRGETLTGWKKESAAQPTETKTTAVEPTEVSKSKAAVVVSGTRRNTLKNSVVSSLLDKSSRSHRVRTSGRRISVANQYAIKQQPAFSSQAVVVRPPNNGVAQVSENVPNKPVETATMPTVSALAGRPGQWPKSLSFTSRELILPDTGEAAFFRKPAVSSQSRQTGFSVRVIVAPDLSTIGLKDFQRPGTNVGMMLEYRLAPRWSVQAGVLRSTKVYKALPTDYVLSPYMMGKDIPISISGTCNLFDVPINLRYDIALRPRPNNLQPSRWFVSGGVTTYIMHREDYTYNYGPHSYNPLVPYSKINSGAYGISQLNVSAGYERALSRRLSWQIEPFVKVPLKGVGIYKINLLSTGAFFSLRYKF